MEYLDKEGIKTLWSKITGKLGDYLPLSGGTMKDNSTITAKNLTLDQGSNQYLYLGNTYGFTILKGAILGDNDILPKWTIKDDTMTAKWFNGCASSATKLANNRTLWGQTFNGEQNVLGNLQLSDSAQNQNNIGLIYSAEFGNASGFIGFEGSGQGVILGWGEYPAIQDNVNISPNSNNTFSVNNSGIKYKGVDVYHANNISTAQTATQTVNGLMSADDKKKLDNLPNISSSQSGESILDYMLAYGVEWTLGQDNPEITRIGNMQLHKTLPIQSNMKGCIVQNGNKVMYYLGENSWKERAIPVEVNCSFTISKSDIRNITIEFPTSIEKDFISKQSTIDFWWLRTGITAGGVAF